MGIEEMQSCSKHLTEWPWCNHDVPEVTREVDTKNWLEVMKLSRVGLFKTFIPLLVSLFKLTTNVYHENI